MGSSLTTGAGLAILDITKTSRSKLATSFGKMKNDMNQLVLDANLAKANAELDYSDRVGEKKLELAEYLATKLGTLYTAISDMKTTIESKIVDHEARLLAKIDASEEVTRNQVKMVVDTMA